MQTPFAAAALALLTIAGGTAHAVGSTDDFYDTRDSIHRSIDNNIDNKDYETVCYFVGDGLQLARDASWIYTHSQTTQAQQEAVSEWRDFMYGYARQCGQMNLNTYRPEPKSTLSAEEMQEQVNAVLDAFRDTGLPEMLQEYNGISGGPMTYAQATAACNKKGGQIESTNYGSYYSCQVNGASAWSVPVSR
ncbi:hypothetical protein OAZ24_05030 [Synechococcus sp. AH-736-G21]|nr:hypothetical protein [Synechococcus sp. AH-736-G21]